MTSSFAQVVACDLSQMRTKRTEAFYRSRRWFLFTADSLEALAGFLAVEAWPKCAAFAVLDCPDNLFVNESCSREQPAYGVLKKPAAPGRAHRRVSGFRAPIGSSEEILGAIRSALAGGDGHPVARVHPRLESRQVHGRCPHCA